ncbi:hypothetical protein [Streptomyces sp. PTD5-9]|uniref:hypothetical protein n=1 Tax=Streptomyces sp. PTD5-9 TaxID=3120150 RepID=UPI00300B809A
MRTTAPGEFVAGDHEAGGRAQDCRSPRVFIAGGRRTWASFGYHQKPSAICLACAIRLNAKSVEIQEAYAPSAAAKQKS